MDLIQIISEGVKNLTPNEVRPYIGASSIGNPCSRAIWYGFKGEERPDHPTPLKITFEVGKRLESMLVDYIEAANFSVERPTAENDYLFLQDSEVPIFQGHCDALLNIGRISAVLEIKTAKNSSFNVFKKEGLKLWSPSYYGQIQSYMGMSGHHHGVVLAINKDSSELHQEWVEYDDIFYHEMRTKALAISISNEPPTRFSTSPLRIECRMCSYKIICHGGL